MLTKSELNNRQFMLSLSEDLLDRFFTRNRIQKPEYIWLPKDDRVLNFCRTCGYYSDKVIRVAPDLCSRLNPRYSWPSFVSDRTPYGVPPHEAGHYIDDLMSSVSDSYSSFVKHTTKEKAITSYAPNDKEWFAEMFRLFLTNPGLLKSIRPITYKLLAKQFKPVEKYDHLEILKFFSAPPIVYTRLAGYIKRA